MAKRFLDDMVKVKRERLRQEGRVMINPVRKPPISRRPLSTKEKQDEEDILAIYEKKAYGRGDTGDKKQERRVLISGGKPRRRYGLWFLAVVALIFLFFAISLLFSKAEISVTPETKNLSLDASFTASKDKSAGGLSFDLVSLSGEEDKTLQGGEEKQVSTPARGQVMIYNAYSASSQVLDINTRLEGSNGKLYKTDKRITVPGEKSDGTPGSVEVGIHAAEGGTDYNSSPLDFKIVGFKGSPKYDKFYGRSKGEISGGLVGTSVTVSDAQKTVALGEMKPALKAKLLEKANGQIPSGYVLWQDAAFLKDTGESLKEGGASGTSVFSMKGTLYGFLIPEAEITREIIQKAMPDYDGSDAFISNLKSLKFSLANSENVDFASASSITFTLSGTPTMVYRFDANKFVSSILGRNKSDFKKIMSGYSHVAGADLSIQPVWRQSFPEDPKEISVDVKYPSVN